MKPTLDIPATLLDNRNDRVFKNDFFERFTLRKAAAPLQLNEKIRKDYLFPTLYGDVTCAIGIFLCSYEKARGLVAKELHPEIKPVKITKGRSLIAFSCYEYKNVMSVPPYNEIAMAIPVMVNAKWNPPVAPMIMKFKHFGYYIAGMPVTSYENQVCAGGTQGGARSSIDCKARGTSGRTARPRPAARSASRKREG